MAAMTPNAKSLKEMLELREELDRAIKANRPKEIEKFKSDVAAMAKERGLDINEIYGSTESEPENLYLPKYINPKDLTQAWGGVGKRPTWLNKRLEEGQDQELFLTDNLSKEFIEKVRRYYKDKLCRSE